MCRIKPIISKSDTNCFYPNLSLFEPAIYSNCHIMRCRMPLPMYASNTAHHRRSVHRTMANFSAFFNACFEADHTSFANYSFSCVFAVFVILFQSLLFMHFTLHFIMFIAFLSSSISSNNLLFSVFLCLFTKLGYT